MIMKRIWAMPNRYTFTIKPIKDLIMRFVKDGRGWIDPFAGMNSPAEFTNDLDKNSKAKYHQDALNFLHSYKNNNFVGAIYDPPFNPVQAKWCYKTSNKYKENTEFYKYMSKCRKEIARIVKPNGLVICCGFNSGGIGKKYGFEIREILLVPHGANRNDTIVTVEQKMNKQIGDLTI